MDSKVQPKKVSMLKAQHNNYNPATHLPYHAAGEAENSPKTGYDEKIVATLKIFMQCFSDHTEPKTLSPTE